MKPWRNLLLLLVVGVLLLGRPGISASQEVKPQGETGERVASRSAAGSVDPRFRSPRATVRTFLIAMNLTEDDPHKIDGAIACLDLSEMPADQRVRTLNVVGYHVGRNVGGSENELQLEGEPAAVPLIGGNL